MNTILEKIKITSKTDEDVSHIIFHDTMRTVQVYPHIRVVAIAILDPVTAGKIYAMYKSDDAVILVEGVGEFVSLNVTHRDGFHVNLEFTLTAELDAF